MYSEHPIPIPLLGYVRRILVTDQNDDIEVASDVRATGYPYLGFLYRGRAKALVDGRTELELDGAAVHISGQVTTDDIQIQFDGAVGHILIELNALASYELFGISGEDAANRCQPPNVLNPSLPDVFSAKTGLGIGHDQESALSAICDAVASHCPHTHDAPDFLHLGLLNMEENNGLVNLGELCGRLGISTRHFSRQFTKYIGQSPKRFCRILQVNRALQAMMNDDATYLSRIASEAGFGDQSHFNRVFRQLLLTNPLDFVNSDQTLLISFLTRRFVNADAGIHL